MHRPGGRLQLLSHQNGRIRGVISPRSAIIPSSGDICPRCRAVHANQLVTREAGRAHLPWGHAQAAAACLYLPRVHVPLVTAAPWPRGAAGPHGVSRPRRQLTRNTASPPVPGIMAGIPPRRPPGRRCCSVILARCLSLRAYRGSNTASPADKGRQRYLISSSIKSGGCRIGVRCLRRMELSRHQECMHYR